MAHGNLRVRWSPMKQEELLASLKDTFARSPKQREMSPVEVGKRIQTLSKADGIEHVAKHVGLRDLGTLRLFVRLLDLPSDVHDSICWGRDQGKVSFSVAAEIARARSASDRRLLCEAAIEKRWSKSEVQGILRQAKSEGRRIADVLPTA
jgi:hypothetical protein